MKHLVESGGVSAEAVQHHVSQKPLPDLVPGEHLWIVTGMWKIDPESYAAGRKTHLDMENLLNLAGPGCFWCERDWSPSLASEPCPG